MGRSRRTGRPSSPIAWRCDLSTNRLRAPAPRQRDEAALSVQLLPTAGPDRAARRASQRHLHRHVRRLSAALLPVALPRIRVGQAPSLRRPLRPPGRRPTCSVSKCMPSWPAQPWNHPIPKPSGSADQFRRSPLGRRAAAAPTFEREFDFLMEVENLVLRGQIDLWFEDRGKTVLVDYKTDRVSAAEAPAHAAAIRAAIAPVRAGAGASHRPRAR